MTPSPPKLADQLWPRLMRTDRAADYISFGTTKFLELVNDGRMPKPVYIDGNPRWDRLELDSAVEDLKDRRRDPVVRDRNRLDDRIRQIKEGKG